MNIYEKIKIDILKYYISNLNISYELKYELLSFIDNYSRIRDVMDLFNYVSNYNQYGYYC